MKRGTVIIAFAGIIVIAAYALFKTLTNKNDHGNIEANQSQAENETRQEETQGREAQGEGETA